MAAEYRLDIHTAAGEKLAEITDFLSLSYARRVNAPGLLSFTLLGNHRVVSQLEHNAQIIVYRRNARLGLDWTPDFWGLFRAQRRWYTDHDLFEARCPGILTMLSWRIVAWPAGITDRSSFTNKPAETIAKTLVAYNAGPQALAANGRIRNGNIAGLTVETDQERGTILDIRCAWDNLLEILQKIASIGGGDYDLAKVGPQNWEFRWYDGQVGDDLSDSILFALERGNMTEPRYTHDRLEEKTVAVVGGQGEGSDREVVVRQGPDWSTSNDIEIFVDARSADSVAALETAGDAHLQETRARQAFDYKVLQTPACYYGLHYKLGDLVSARYGTIQVTQKIVGVSVSLAADGKEEIEVELETL